MYQAQTIQIRSVQKAMEENLDVVGIAMDVTSASGNFTILIPGHTGGLATFDSIEPFVQTCT